MKKLSVVCKSLVACLLIFTARNASATKTAVALPVQITANTQTVAQNGAVEYLVRISNQTSSSYWGVTSTVNFPSSVSCTNIVSQTRGGCKLTGNQLSCYWADFYDWWVADVRVACTAVACTAAAHPRWCPFR